MEEDEWPEIKEQLLPAYQAHADSYATFMQALVAYTWPPEVQADIDALVTELSADATFFAAVAQATTFHRSRRCRPPSRAEQPRSCGQSSGCRRTSTTTPTTAVTWVSRQRCRERSRRVSCSELLSCPQRFAAVVGRATSQQRTQRHTGTTRRPRGRWPRSWCEAGADVEVVVDEALDVALVDLVAGARVSSMRSAIAYTANATRMATTMMTTASGVPVRRLRIDGRAHVAEVAATSALIAATTPRMPCTAAMRERSCSLVRSAPHSPQNPCSPQVKRVADGRRRR